MMCVKGYKFSIIRGNCVLRISSTAWRLQLVYNRVYLNVVESGSHVFPSPQQTDRHTHIYIHTQRHTYTYIHTHIHTHTHRETYTQR